MGEWAAGDTVERGSDLAAERQVSIRQLGAESFVAHIVSSPYREKVILALKQHKTPLHMDVELPKLQAITAARGTYYLADGRRVSRVLDGSCKVRG